MLEALERNEKKARNRRDEIMKKIKETGEITEEDQNDLIEAQKVISFCLNLRLECMKKLYELIYE